MVHWGSNRFAFAHIVSFERIKDVLVLGHLEASGLMVIFNVHSKEI